MNSPGRFPRRARRWAAVVEMALVLPVLVAVVFGVLSLGHLIYFRKSLVAGAYEGARLASKRAAGTSETTTRVQQILASRRITDATITLTPASLDGAAPGTQITVRVEAPFHTLGSSGYARAFSRTVAADATILRE